MNNQIVSAVEIARLLLTYDPRREYFCDGEMLTKEGGVKPPTIGNFRLNKMLHICYMLHYAKYGEPLFYEDLRAYHHGAIVYPIFKNFFSFYRENLNSEEISIEPQKKYLLVKFFTILRITKIET